MSSGSKEPLSIPRPGAAPDATLQPISGPSEDLFTQPFGNILPPVKYLTTSHGKAAYYSLPTTSASTHVVTHDIDRVLLIHGVQTPAIGMFPLAHALQLSFPTTQFVLLDLWGHGLSDTPMIPHEPSAFHELIDTLLDELAWKSAHLIGFSFGGALTAGYVASHAARIQSFVLVAPAGLMHVANLSAEECRQLYDSGEAVARKWVTQWLEDGELVVPADWKERVAKGHVVAEAVRAWETREHAGHPASVVAIIRDGGVFDSDAAFAKAAQTGLPSLAVLGELDDVCSEQDLKNLGFAELVTIAGAGHSVVRERASEVAEAITKLWRGLK